MRDPSTAWEDGLLGTDSACLYILEGGKACGAPRNSRSSYCAEHHAVCYLTPDQAKERQREFDAYAAAVGGRAAFSIRNPTGAKLTFLEWKAKQQGKNVTSVEHDAGE
jgi:hypothetical protein